MAIEVLTQPEPGEWTGSGRAPARPAQPPVSMIERMTLILDAFDSETRTLTLIGLAKRTGLPRSTIHRIADLPNHLRQSRIAPRTDPHPRQADVAMDNEESVTGVARVAMPIRGRGAALFISGWIGGDRSSLVTARLARVLGQVAQEAGRVLFLRRVRRHQHSASGAG